MDERLRKYLGTKMVAIGFIALILMGNYWFVKDFTVPGYTNQYLSDAFLLAALWTACWMVPVVVKYFTIKLENKNRKISNEDGDSSLDTK